MGLLLKKRESLPSEWKQAGAKDLGLEVLNHIMRENIILVENLEYTRKEEKSDMQLKIREMQLTKFQEQIKVRDDLLNHARRTYERQNIDY